MSAPRAWACVLILAAAFVPRSAARADDAAPSRPPVLWKVPAFAFVDQDGRRFTDRDLRGRTWIADFIYTQCTSLCPLLSAHMVRLQRQTLGRDVRFVSFSVDPAHDRPAALKAYARRWHGDEARWKLLDTLDAGKLARLLEAMHTEALPGPSEDNAIMHSEWFQLIDARGRVRGRYDSADPDAMKALAADASALAGPAAAAASAPPVEGREIFASLGCAGCHSDVRIAPALEGLAGSTVAFDDGMVAVADAAYLRESVLEPSKKVVAGYPDVMPSYRDQLTETQADALVAYLTSLAGRAAQPAAPRTTRKDPVCGMTISVTADSPHALYKGTTYYFCSDTCRDSFARSPERYLEPRPVAALPGAP